MNAQIPDYWPMLQAYHRAREPLYRQIIADAFCDLAPDARILDAGCGDTFYSELIRQTLSPQTHIIAFDHNVAVFPAPSETKGPIHFCCGDLERPGLRRGAFDAIWFCRAMHSALDPVRSLSVLMPLLRPGTGRLIVVENDSAHFPIFSWPADFEHRLRSAQHQYLKSNCPDSPSLERYHAARHLPAWLARVGLQEISTHTYTSEDVAPFSSEVETYWRLFMALESLRLEPFLAPDDLVRYSSAFDLSSPDYLLRQPGFYSLELTTVARGFAPRSVETRDPEE